MIEQKWIWTYEGKKKKCKAKRWAIEQKWNDRIKWNVKSEKKNLNAASVWIKFCLGFFPYFFKWKIQYEIKLYSRTWNYEKKIGKGRRQTIVQKWMIDWQ